MENLYTIHNDSSELENDDVQIELYEHYLAVNLHEIIRANVVYTVLDNNQVIGCYSGYAGGGIYDCRFIWIDDTWSECVVTDDESEFDESLTSYFLAIQKVRSEFENWDDEDVIKISEKGKEFLNFDDSAEELIVNMTEGFELDVIELAQEQWSLLYKLGE